MSKAVDLIYDLSLWMPDGWRGNSRGYPYNSKYGPGQVVESMSEEKRAALKELKSDDLIKMRPDAVYVEESRGQRQKRQFSEDKLKFDKEMLGLQ